MSAENVSYQDLIKAAYAAFFGREPDSEGSKFWLAQLQSGQLTETEFLQTLLSVPEYGHQDLIRAAYIVFCGRKPDTEGLVYWQDMLKSGKASESDFLKAMISSTEFIDRMRDNPVIAAWFGAGRWEKLVQLNADITVPLQVEDDEGRPLRITGSILDASVFTSIIDNDGLWEPHVTSFIQETLKPGQTFFDVGANLGYFTLLGASLVATSGQVVSFEPVKVNFEYCQQNIALNSLSNVTLFNYGLWSGETTHQVSLSRTNLGGPRILRADDPESEQAAQETITCYALDNLFRTGRLTVPQVHLIKMDIEGAEIFALEGMSRTLARYKPTIVMEFNRYSLRSLYDLDSDDLWTVIESLNYQIFLLSTELTSQQRVELIEIKEKEYLDHLCPPEALIDVVLVPRD